MTKRAPNGLRDAILVLPIAMFAAAAPALMRLKLSTVERLLEPRSTRSHPDAATVATIVRSVDRALYWGSPLVSRTCVTRGLTLYYFLRRAGVDVTLCFGMGTPARELEGHCWLLRDGEPYLERRDPRPIFRETYRIPRPRAAS